MAENELGAAGGDFEHAYVRGLEFKEERLE